MEPERIELTKQSRIDTVEWPTAGTILDKELPAGLGHVTIRAGSNAKIEFSGGTIADSVLVIGDDGVWVLWPRPIPVGERPPKKRGWYFAYAPRKHWITPVWQLAFWETEIAPGEGVWASDDSPMVELAVTHWLPLPPDP